MSLLRRSLAVGLCIGLLVPPPGWGPSLSARDYKSTQELQAGLPSWEVMGFLEEHHAFDGSSAELRQYVVGDGVVTPFGAVLYRYLKSQPNPDEEAQNLQESFKTLAKSGPYSGQKAAAFETALQRYVDKFGSLPAAPDQAAEDTFELGTLREAMMTGASVKDAPKAKFTQVDLGPGQGWQFWDKDGLAFELNKHKVAIYKRDLQKMQREINKTRPQQAAFVPETGRYNHEMFGVSYLRLKLQADQIKLATRLDRMVCMAELLGEQKRDQVFFDKNDPSRINEAFENELEKKAGAKKYTHKGQIYSVLQIAEAKTRVRSGYLQKADEGIVYFRDEMEKFKGAAAITDSQAKSMEMGEQFVMRYLSLAFLEAQKYALRSQLERLDPESPDSQMVGEGLKAMPLDSAAKSRYKDEGGKLRKRLERLGAVLGRVEDVLCKTDYASSLDLAQAALNSSQKELGEIGTNYEVYTAAPGMLLALQQQSGFSFNGSFDPRKWSGSVWHKAAAGTHVSSSYTKGIEDADRSLTAYQGIAGTISDGKYWDARKAIIALNPDAVYQHPAMSLNGETAKINDAARLAAALKATRASITRIAEVNRWVDTAGNFITWSVAVGLGAPVVRKGLAVVETAANKVGLKFIAALAEQVRLKLASLEPAQERLSGNAGGVLGEYLRHSACRTVSFAVRQAGFTLMSGTLSGAAMALGDLTGRAPFKINLGVVKFGEGDSNFKNPGDAFAQGFSGGVYWANESFHPMLGYVGLPSSYFEGGPLAGFAQTLGAKGAAGSAGQLAKWGVGKAAQHSTLVAKVSEHVGNVFNSISEGFAAKAGGSMILSGASKVMQFAWGTADSLAKYMVFSEGVGWGSKQVGGYMYRNEADVARPGVSEDEREQLKDMPLEVVAGLERRIKRSEKASEAWANSPLWLIIPTYPAKYEAAAQSFQRSSQGEKEYIDHRRNALLANAEADQTYLPMLGKNTTPWMQFMFSYTHKGAKESDATFLVTKEIKRKAIARELKQYVSGGNAEADIGTINPAEFLKISRSDTAERKMIGELFNLDDVRNESRKQCVLVLTKNPTLAEDILKAKPGSNVPGFGRVNPGVQREVAAMMLEELPAGVKVSHKIQGLAQGYIQRYLDSNSLGKAGGPAERLLKASKANAKETPVQAEAFDRFVKELRESVVQWGQDVERKATDKPYMKLSEELRGKLEAKSKAGGLSPEQSQVLESMFNLIDKQEQRFQSFNNVETTHQLISEELAALRVQYEKNDGATKLLKQFGDKLSAWRGSEVQHTPPVADAAPFKAMLSEFRKSVDDALTAKSISPEDAEALRDVISRDMKGAPWILHDSKGTALSGWRPGQFVTYFDSLTKVVESRGQSIRAFERLTTGGGKTLLTFEGLMPIAEADARLEGKGRKVSFFTVQSNLDAQAQLEWRALRRVGSQLEFDTYEGLKSEIAQAKDKGQEYVDKIWILGDEMDGAALQPALTLGETTGKITRLNSVYSRMEQLNERMEQLLQRGAVELSEKVKVQARLAQSVIDGLGARTPQSGAARAATEKLIKAAEELSTAQSPAALVKVTEAVRLRLAELKAAASASAGLPDVQKVQAAADKISELLNNGVAVDPVARQVVNREVSDNLARQKNLLSLVGGDASARLESLRVEAVGLRESAEARIQGVERKLAGLEERLKKTPNDPDLAAQKKALGSEMGLARQDLALAQRFAGDQLGRAQRLIEKVFEIQEQFPAEKAGRGQAKIDAALHRRDSVRQGLSAEQNASLDAYRQDVAKLYDVGRRMAKADGDILKAAKAGRPIESFQRELAKLQAEADGVQVRLAQAREAARPQITVADLQAVNSRFSDNSKTILELLDRGDAESQAAALRLLQGRKALLESYAGTESSLYGIYKKMKADAYSVAHSPIWERDEAEVARKAVEKSQALMTGGAEELSSGLKSVEGLAQSGEPEIALKLRRRAEGILHDQAQKWQDLSGRGPGDRQATLKNLGEAVDAASLHATERERFLKALRAQKPGLEISFVERLESVFQAADAREAALKTGVELQLRNMEMTQDKAVKLYDQRIKGLTRGYAQQMMKEILADPLMPAGQRDQLFAKALTSYLFPSRQYGVEWSILGSRWPPTQWIRPRFSIKPESSWVREEFTNLVRGYFDDYATVRMDNLTHKTNVIHNGQWFETMDNPTRRFWELEYGTDITLPYTQKNLSTIKDVTSNKKARMFALSATAGEKYVKHLVESNVSVGGQGAQKPDNVSVDVRAGEAGKFTGVAEAMGRALQRSNELVAVRPSEVLSSEAAPPEVRAYLEGQGYAKKDALVLDLGSLRDNPVVYDYFVKLRQRQGVRLEGARWPGAAGRPQTSTSLVVISLPDTRALKTMREYLINSGLATKEEIAQVFSDTEYLRLNRPQADVAKQMNLLNMKPGKVKVLLLDTRVGGRGLDLDYKGDKGDPRLDAFKGYTNYEMLVMDPNQMSAVHLLQAEGRIDVGRVLLGAQRNFRLMMDVKTLQKDAVFEDMYRNNDVFVNLRNDPAVHQFAHDESNRLKRPVDLDWSLIDSYIKQKTEPSSDLAKRYNQVISENLERKQQLIEEDQLRQSSVLQDQPKADVPNKLRWLDALQRGR